MEATKLSTLLHNPTHLLYVIVNVALLTLCQRAYRAYQLRTHLNVDFPAILVLRQYRYDLCSLYRTDTGQVFI